MAVTTAGIEALAERYEPDVIDVPGGRGLVRLEVRGGEDWDARLTSRRMRLVPVSPGDQPDATITADATPGARSRRTCAAA